MKGEKCGDQIKKTKKIKDVQRAKMKMKYIWKYVWYMILGTTDEFIKYASCGAICKNDFSKVFFWIANNGKTFTFKMKKIYDSEIYVGMTVPYKSLDIL